MIVYHGSYMEVKTPNIAFSRENVDFGKGFYTTPIKAQAEKWATRFRRKKGNSIVSIYEVDEEKLKQDVRVLEFTEYTEAWLDYIVTCRRGKNSLKYDVVIGGVANDKVFDTIELFFDGLIDKTVAIERLRYEKPNFQVCFCSQKVIEQYVRFIDSEVVL
ncbi:MAG: DUF3990 domain-containing protein [Clostridium sp.]